MENILHKYAIQLGLVSNKSFRQWDESWGLSKEPFEIGLLNV